MRSPENELDSMEFLDSEDMASDSHSFLELNRISLVDKDSKRPEVVANFDLYEYIDGDIPVNFNILFATEFGEKQEEFYTEDTFLHNQFFLVQKYIEDKGISNYGIFSMSALDQPIYVEVENSDDPDIVEQVDLGTDQSQDIDKERLR